MTQEQVQEQVVEQVIKSKKKIANCPKCHDFKRVKNIEGKIIDCREC